MRPGTGSGRAVGDLVDASLTAVHALTDISLTDDRAVRDAYRNASQLNAANLSEELA